MNSRILSALLLNAAILFVSSDLLYAQSDPTKEILVYFASGIDRAPAGQAAPVRSGAIQRLLTQFNIPGSHVISAFPTFLEADTLKKSPDGRTISLPNMGRIFRIQVPDSITGNALVDSLKKLPNVIFAEPNMSARLFSDPTYGNQWHLNNTGQSGGTSGADIRAEQAWSIFTGSSSVTIAVVDAGVETSHEDLSGKASGDSPDGDYHGTHVAGIAAAKANNDKGGRGVDWNAQILSKQIFSTAYISYPDNPDGYMGDVNTYNKVVSAVDNGAAIVNNSWGGPYTTTVRMAFAYAYKMNRVATASMGNSYQSGNPTIYPAAFSQGIIAVGATTDADARSSFSQTGNHISVVAPGGINPYPNNNQHDIWSTWGNNSYRYLAGTSMATPVVSGIASLLRGYNSNLYNDDVQRIIQLSADDKGDPGWDQYYGYGRVNAKRALDYLRSPYALTQATATGGTDVGSTGTYQMRIYSVSGLDPVIYNVKRHDVQKTVTFSSKRNHFAWGRGVAATGWSTESPNFAMGWCDVVPGTLTGTNMTLRTYVYEVWTLSGLFMGWYPTTPQNAVYAYTILSPLVATISGPLSLWVGQQGTWTVTATGGSTSYTYAWYVRSADPIGHGSWIGPVSTTTSYSTTMHDYDQYLDIRCDVASGSQQTSVTRHVICEDCSGGPRSIAQMSDSSQLRDATIDLPSDFMLGQNFPNPFNPTTNISFALPKSTYVKLVVYDMIGKEVARLVDGQLAAGYHTVTWDASRVASGIYIYRLSTAEFVQIRRMVVMK